MSVPDYLVSCEKCKASPFSRCVTPKGRATDTHRVRVDQQFDNPDMATVVRRVLYGVYGKFVASYAPERVCREWLNPGWSQPDPNGRDALMMYLWINTSGGGTAEYASVKIREAVDNFYRIKGTENG